MKSSFRLFIGTATLCLTVLLSACGQPGPLYLPKIPPAKPAKSTEAAPAPSTPPAPQQ
ncbi:MULTISPECIES: LPS translocon maturation chaperone LptM [Duganella]|uniref:LPS translocon maturation chaperone LptM n=1 Tax=Duganella TaxID=75654 RepID=UPI00159DE11D